MYKHINFTLKNTHSWENNIVYLDFCMWEYFCTSFNFMEAYDPKKAKLPRKEWEAVEIL